MLVSPHRDWGPPIIVHFPPPRRLAGVCTKLHPNFIRRFVITENAPTRAFSWLKAATTAFTFKTLLRHYAKRALTPRSLNLKLGPRQIIIRDGRL